MKHILTLLALIALCLTVQAKPARRGAMTVTQPDGTTVTAYLHGDEYYHYYTNADGEMLEKDADGYYRATAMPSEQQIHARRMNSPRRIAMQQMAGQERNLAPRGLIILVNFSNLAFKTQVAEMDSMINGLNYSRTYQGYNSSGRKTTITAKGSARQYFRETSMGQYKPEFDVIGPVTLDNEYSYYGANDSRGDDVKAEYMIQEACELVDSLVDFSIYDNNNDGKVDFVYVIYAGYSESDGAGDDYIWPHNYYLSASGVNCFVDGKRVDNYACSSELDYQTRKHDGIGTFCHEFSHVLGLPDLYATDNSTHKTMGAWDILDYGPYNNDGNTPPHYSAYERFFMGWLKPTLLTEACDVRLADLGTSNTAVILTESGTHNLEGNNPNPTTFYLLENRQNEGWDKYLPGHGLLVTKIAYSQRKWSDNTVNNAKNAMGVDIIEADGSAPTYNAYVDNGYTGKATDAFPAGADSFTQVTSYQVTDIEETDGYIYFKLNGGGESVHLAVEDVNQPKAVQPKKIYRDGKIWIEHNGEYYDLLGNRQ